MTTPAEKDAMALAGLAHVAENMVPLATKKDVQVRLERAERFASNIRTHSAHLAARVAELEKMLVDYEQDYPPTVRALRESTGRATRAEAELAAMLAFLRDDATAISYQSLGQYRKAALDAARGAG